MISGTVKPSREAAIRLLVRGQGSSFQEIEVVIDTGFNSFLTLPPTTISRLALPFVGPTRATLADGSDVEMQVFEAVVLWDGEERDVSVLEAEGGPLIGMALLYGHELKVHVVDGGVVTIMALN